MGDKNEKMSFLEMYDQTNEVKDFHKLLVKVLRSKVVSDSIIVYSCRKLDKYFTNRSDYLLNIRKTRMNAL